MIDQQHLYRSGWCAALLCALDLVGQIGPGMEWQRSLGGSMDDQAYTIRQTSDGGFIMAGSTFSNNGDVSNLNGESDIWIVKLDNSGEIEWQKAIGGSAFETARDIQQTLEGGFIIAGNTNSNDGDVTGNHGLRDYWIVKLTNSGTIQWQKALGGAGNDAAYALQQTNDGGYIVVGESASDDGDVQFNHGGLDCWVVKIDSNGEIEWERSYGGNFSDIGLSIRQTADNGYIIGATTSSTNGDITDPLGDVDFWAVKINATGELQWQRNYGGSGFETNCIIIPRGEGEYAIAGTTSSTDGDIMESLGLSDIWLAGLDEAGDIIWSRSYGGSATDIVRSLQEIPNGYVVLGSTNSADGNVESNNGLSDAWIFKTNQSGELIWQQTWGGTGYDGFADGTITTEGGFIAAGSTTSTDGDVSGNHGAMDCWLVKLSSDPLALLDPFQSKDVDIWPNPAKDEAFVQVDGDLVGISDVQVLSLAGAHVTDLTVYSSEGSSHVYRIDLSEFPSGIYILSIQTERGRFIRPLMIE